MTVTSTKYGTMETHRGTLAEVMTAVVGYPPTHILSVFYDGASVVAVVQLYQ